jgi:S1-C subfamily serine protease
VRAIAQAGLLAAAAASSAATAAPGPLDLSANPLDRAWLAALPAVYRVDVRVQVAALRTRAGRRITLPQLARDLSEAGTGFGVDPEGTVVTARHVLQPDGPDAATRLWWLAQVHSGHPRYTQRQAMAWVIAQGARPAGVRVLSITLRPAMPEPTGGEPVTYPAQIRALSDRDRDLALLDAPIRNAPALALDGASTTGTPVVVLGFGGDEGGLPPDEREMLVPARREGVIYRTFFQGVGVTADIQQGDSGGPAVDPEARAHGMVFRMRSGPGGYIKSADSVRDLLTREGLSSDPGPTTRHFLAALALLRRFDLEGAARELRTTLRLFPRHAVARQELARVEALQAVGYRLSGPSRRRGALLAIGIISALLAVGCAIGLLRPRQAPAPRTGPRGHRRLPSP